MLCGWSCGMLCGWSCGEEHSSSQHWRRAATDGSGRAKAKMLLLVSGVEGKLREAEKYGAGINNGSILEYLRLKGSMGLVCRGGGWGGDT